MSAQPSAPELHVPTAGLYCVPTALQVITGECHEFVLAALNRASGRGYLWDDAAGENMSRARKALEELGWQVRAYTGDHLSSLVSTWAKRFPERTILIAAGGRGCGHAMVLRGGRIYDSHHPFGVDGADHIYSNAKVTWAAMVSYPG